MSNTILTSQRRILGLPLSLCELNEDEKIVATTADMGMLFVKNSSGQETLIDYSDIDPENLPDGMPISIPYIRDYKYIKIEDLKRQIEVFEDLTD